MDIAQFLRSRLDEIGITQSSFARRAGLSPGPVSKWLSRKGTPDMESCLKIAAFFKEDPIQVFRLAGREDLVQLHQKFMPEYRKILLSEDDLYEKDEHVRLHRGLQRLLEHGMESPADVEIGVELLQTSLQAILEREKKFRKLVENVQVIPWEAEPQMKKYLYVGPQAQEILGYAPEEWYDEGFWFKHLHPADRNRVIRTYRKASRTQQNYDCEYRMLDREGRPVWLKDVVSVGNNGDGSSLLRGFLININQLKETEQKLKESEGRYRALVELSPDAIVVHNGQKILYCNPAAVTLFGGRSKRNLVGRKLSDLILEESWPGAQARIRRVLQEGRVQTFFSEKIRRLDQQEVDVDIAAGPILFGGEQAVQTILRIRS